MLRDVVTGEEREVDIVIEFQVAGHRITVGVECTAQARKSSVGWVERMRDTHQNYHHSCMSLVGSTGSGSHQRMVGFRQFAELFVASTMIGVHSFGFVAISCLDFFATNRRSQSEGNIMASA